MLALASCGSKESKLEVEFPSKFEGKDVELLNYLDSTVIGTSRIAEGRAEFITVPGERPAMMQIMVEGRVQGYYIAEQGTALITDSTAIATGTPLNDRFRTLMATLDSIENLDDMDKYAAYAEKAYNENRETAIGDFFAVEWLKFADPSKTDSLLAKASPALRESKRVKHYAAFARRRAATSPGVRYTDVEGENASGKKTRLSALVTPGKYTVVDFWASWCPYCIKEIPELKRLLSDFGKQGLDIVGVAVRDLPEDTRLTAGKHGIDWKILYNTQKAPYDVYGFSGIPHHILIGPDGVIISRGENVAQLRTRLERLLEKKESK